ncbi:Bacteriophage holin family protein [Cnuella takakiae]|uniref:Bacteriophage holin family protein n=1 Tax=Cnuella takakiae TaxID=1302690 RepID=A0A1M5G1V3_9BACT|nr:phage holin family protein [Cnuella takakiae]OLY92303.1 hypothetical protein BUE76_10655 [Cnuella takakiae]SHF97807.1 Bacteriophage holin family protein [Cnuella takakiae]
MKTALIYVSLLFIKVSILPNTNLLIWMALAMTLDFLTGFSKAVVLNQARTSGCLRKTITKFVQYGGAVAVSVVLSQSAEQHKMQDAMRLASILGDALVVFIIYIEITSIFENLIAIDSESPIAKYFFVPAHKILTAQIKRSPAVQAAENLDQVKP